MSFSEIVLLIVILVIAIILLKFIIKVALILLGVCLVITAGPLILIGFIFEKIFKIIKIRFLMAVLFTMLVWVATFAFGFLGYHPTMHRLAFDSLKYIIPACLFILMIYSHHKYKYVEPLSEPLFFFDKKKSEYYLFFYSAFIFLIISVSASFAFSILGWPPKIAWYIDLAYWIGAIFIQAYFIVQNFERKSIMTGINVILSSSDKIEKNSLLQEMITNFSSAEKDEVEILLQGIAARMINLGTIDEVALNGNCWFFNSTWHQKKKYALKSILTHDIKHSEEDIVKMLTHRFNLPVEECREYVNSYLDFGAKYNFIDGSFFVLFENLGRINTCFSCGTAEVVDGSSGSEWYCSDVCKETEDLCRKIKEKPYEIFINEAQKSGFSLMAEYLDYKSDVASNNPWSKKEKPIFTGEQEFVLMENNGTDVVKVKNALNRLVDEQIFQTKYYSTASKTIESAFESLKGTYLYMDNEGKPIQLEVPKDQYDEALKIMITKILEGKVPGVIDPDMAKGLIVKGIFAYQQIINLVKFGSLDCVVYDSIEGSLTSTFPGGINFVCTALIAYLKDKDKDAASAFRTAAIICGNTFTKKFVMSATTEQLQRLSGIEHTIGSINIQKFSSITMREVISKNNFFQKMGINKTLQSNIINSVIMIAASTGSDFVKLVRGRISQAQFLANMAVASSGIAGGVIGSTIASGFLLSTLGPLGVFLGQAAGSIISASISSTLATKIAEADRKKILVLIKSQMEYLSISFMLTEDEIENMSSNLDKMICKETLDFLFTSGNQRSTVNFLLKPVIASIIKQRPELEYKYNSVIAACAALAT